VIGFDLRSVIGSAVRCVAEIRSYFHKHGDGMTLRGLLSPRIIFAKLREAESLQNVPRQELAV
jgi:hypothetical protein